MSSKGAAYGPTVQLGELDSPPNALTMMEPEFSPELQKEAEAHGFATTVEFVVDSAGAPRDLKLTKTSSPAFGRSAMSAVSKWKFKPRVVDGKPVSTPLTIAFRMRKERPKATGAADPVLSEKRPEVEKTMDIGCMVTAIIDSIGRPHDLKIANGSCAAFGKNAGSTENIVPTP